MIRLVLEEVCIHQLEANSSDGKSLHQRLKELADNTSLSAAMVDGLNKLKLLGNDSVHVFTKNFEASPDNVGLALEIVVHLLKVVYQEDALVAKLKALDESA